MNDEFKQIHLPVTVRQKSRREIARELAKEYADLERKIMIVRQLLKEYENDFPQNPV